RELRGPETGVLDFLDVLAPGILGWRGVQQQLGAAEDRREEIIEVVSDAPGELPYRFPLLGLPQLVLRLTAVGGVSRVYQAGGAACEGDRLRFDVHVDQRAVLAAVAESGESPAGVVMQRLLEAGELRRRPDVAHRHRQELLLRVAVALHRGGVHRQEA